MSGFRVWITAIWILLLVIFDVAFSNYSEDQCSWRGRQVLINVSVPFVSAFDLIKERLKMPTRDATGVSFFLERMAAE